MNTIKEQVETDLKELRILMVDDHPIILEGYRNALHKIYDDRYNLHIETANSCSTGYKALKCSIESKRLYDVVLLDLKIPPMEDESLETGADLGLKFKELSPNTKIVVLTMYNDNFHINNVIKNVNPDGFLVKSDITSKDFGNAFNQIMNTPPHYSLSVIKMLRLQISGGIELDEIDRNILYHLSRGVKTIHLKKYIPLSVASIEKRKRRLKALLSDDEKISDYLFLKLARKKDLI